MKQNTKMTAAERAANEARVKDSREVTSEIESSLEKDVDVNEVPAKEPSINEPVAKEVTSTPTQEVEVTEVTEISEDEDNAKKHEKTDNGTHGFVKALKWIGSIVGIAALVGILIMLILMYIGKDNNQLPDDGTVPPENGVVDTTPGGDKVPDPNNSVDSEFDMDAFVASVENIAKTLTTDKDISTNVDIFVEKIGEDKLVELINKYGELTVQKAIAEYLAFVPEIKMNQYISNNGLDYNLRAKNDWYNKIDEAEAVYKEATGKNPEGAFMSLEGYDTYKNNREVMKTLIIESGDTALLNWYEVKTDGYDVMVQQERDTEEAHAYKEKVKLELVNNVNGSVKLIELQLEQNINGTDADTLNYTKVYEEFIINNYMYVVAN